MGIVIPSEAANSERSERSLIWGTKIGGGASEEEPVDFVLMPPIHETTF